MSSEYEVADTLDVTGLNCPMPVVKTKQAIDDVAPGDVLEVVATDAGSIPDIEGWADATASAELLEQIEDDSGGETLYKHYVRRVDA
jgi:TusA-related sulfurtransferase